ncbi:uncharacterized protein [Argopecten irradians]|uniref:uncharacterized protein n=1 Tax=Argopecten irradians TaxID=31199 RepID=UPI00371B5DBC
MYSNVDSLLNKRQELKTVVDQENPSIIALTEILPKNNPGNLNPCEFNIDGYDMFTVSLETGRGVVIYIKSNLKGDIEEHLMQSNFSEAIWCTLSLYKSQKLVIGCIYRSPSSSTENSLELNKAIQTVCEKYYNIIIMGDFNYKNIDWSRETTPENLGSSTDKFLECVQGHTRHRQGNEPSTLDLVLSKDEDTVKNLRIDSPLGKSDHVTIFYNIEIVIDKDNTTKNNYCFYRGNNESMSLEISNIDWENNMDELNTVDAWAYFVDKIKSSMERYIPVTKSRPGRRHRKAWMNVETINTLKRKRKTWEIYKRNKTNANWETYRLARNRATSSLRSASIQYESKIAKEFKTDSKSFWKFIKSRTNTKTGVPDLELENGVIETEDEGKSKELNKFFASVFTKEDHNIIPTPTTVNLQSELLEIHVTTEEVFKKLSKLDGSKSPGPDGLHPKVLKELSQCISLAHNTLHTWEAVLT